MAGAFITLSDCLDFSSFDHLDAIETSQNFAIFRGIGVTGRFGPIPVRTPGRFGPIPFWSGRVSLDRFGPILGVGHFGAILVGSFGAPYFS